jgi:hypothetical protein
MSAAKSKRPPRKIYGFPIVNDLDEHLAKRIDSVVDALREAEPRLGASRAVLIRMCCEQTIGLFEKNPFRYKEFLDARPRLAIDQLVAQRKGTPTDQAPK